LFLYVHMIVRIVLIGIVMLTGGRLWADGEHLAILKIGEEIYTNVTVTSASATDIFFTHSRGIGNAKLKNVEPAVQKMFHFDAAKAAAKQAQEARANALYNQTALNAPAPKRPKALEPEPEAQQDGSENGIPARPVHAKRFLNQKAPSLQVEKWLTEPPDTNGKFVLLDFWATWCGPCRHSIPELNHLHAKFKDRLVVVGLSDEPEQEVRKMQDPKIDYAIAIDTRHRTETEVEVKGIPHTMLIDPNGIVRFEGMPHYLSEKDLVRLLSKFSR
jgi:cytochrome c biogenesis protein CcmG, thiol:disulfide interchange protein DsbE